ncbi:hypothetical protein BC940DRAFT_296391 [Gongronella butleri]|nr:hypothetical protein BC940DRAFT_296391 [Gongronella butleri]
MASQVTILRIKRKRFEEPLDTLLVQDQHKKQHTEKRIRRDSIAKDKAPKTPAVVLPKVFRFAETVEEGSFSSASEAKKLKDRIARHMDPKTRHIRTDDEKRKSKVDEAKNIAKQARYRVLNQHRNSANLPPVVQSSDEKAVQDMFDMYDAVKDEEKGPQLYMDEDEEDPDDIMCNFIPMVKEYLSLKDKDPEDDYVYDVYYCDVSSTQTSITGANVAELVWFDDDNEYLNDDSDSELGDIEDEDSNAEDYYQNDYPDEVSDEDFEEQEFGEDDSDNYDEEYDYYYA